MKLQLSPGKSTYQSTVQEFLDRLPLGKAMTVTEVCVATGVPGWFLTRSAPARTIPGYVFKVSGNPMNYLASAKTVQKYNTENGNG